MRNILQGGLLLAAFFFCGTAKSQNIYDLPCPAGSSPIPQGMQTTVPQTGHLRANTCVDANGVMTYQGLGGTVGATNSAPNMGTYLGQSCNTANTNQCFFTFADLQLANDCNWNAVVTDVFCTVGHFVATDCVGGAGCTGTGLSKSFMGAQSFAGDNQGSGAGGQIHLTANVTIASFISPTHITLSVVPANAVASNGSIAWGHLDDTGADAMDAFMQAAATCPIAMLSGGYYYFSRPHFNYVNATSVSGNGCGALPTTASYTGSSFGTVSFPAGFALEGRYGTGPTSIFLDTSFPGGDSCAHTVTGATLPACFAIPIMGKWSNILISGGNQPSAPNLNGKTLLSMQVGALENWTGMNIGWNNATVTGIAFSTLSQFATVNNAGFGCTGMSAVGGTAYARAVGLIIENSACAALTLGAASAAGTPTLTSYWGIYDMPQGVTNKQVIINAGGNLVLIGGTVQPSNTPSTTNTGMTAYKCTGTGGSLIADSVNFNFTIGGSAQNAIWLAAQNCTASISKSFISSNQAGSAVINDNGSTSGTKVFSLGGNIWSGSVNITAGLGLFLNPTDTFTSFANFTPSCTMTTGGGTGPACALIAGSTNERGTVRMTPGTTPAANGTTTVTLVGNFSGATGTTPSCIVSLANTGTGTWNLAADIQLNTRSSTVPVFLWNNTLALTGASTYDFDYVCVPK